MTATKMAEAANRYEWERIIRRIRTDVTTKCVALTLATYANANGTNARPGVPRLAAVVGVSERTVQRALIRLREDYRLIVRTTVGSSLGRRAVTDCYRLIIPADLLERVTLLDPSEQVTSGVTRSGQELVTPESHQFGEEQVTPETEQVTPVTGTGDTAMSPHQPTDHPYDQIIHLPEVTSPRDGVDWAKWKELVSVVGEGQAYELAVRQADKQGSCNHMFSSVLGQVLTDVRQAS